MKLYEFFDQITMSTSGQDDRDAGSISHEELINLEDEVYWFILDHNVLHKKYFIPIARKLKAKYDDTTDDSSKDWKEWLPMVNRGCIDYLKEHNVPGDPKEVFSKKFRKDLCMKIEEYYRQCITDDEYDLGI